MVQRVLKSLKIVSQYMIQAKARSLAQKTTYQAIYPNINEAKFSQKWIDGFMIRHNLVNRRKTTNCSTASRRLHWATK